MARSRPSTEIDEQADPETTDGNRPGVFAVLPTYRRDDELAEGLRVLAGQTLLPELVLVVDNAGTESCRRVCAQRVSESPRPTVEYVSPGSNLGPAGATALGMSSILTRARDHDWILRCDDDSHLPNPDKLKNLVDRANDLRARDPMVAGVGVTGSRLDYRRFRLIKPPPGNSSIVDVDYLATNRWPLYSVNAVRSVGVFREDLFFGLSEVEYGLRLRRGGYRLCRIDSGETRRPSRVSLRLGVASWRRYYSLRNMIVIAREYSGTSVALRVALVRALLKPILNLPLEPRNAIRHLRLGLKAVRDAVGGRMGRTVEPTLIEGQLDTRSEAQPLEG